ncbi:unnamed protein product [Schistocephalus solidus]|uniref:3'(2'),5'-bisphosphate nucleotidase 1 n=1 Tax=Schistocephalus solidus TaxID=70667 RepID=A0A3P7EGT8_SCHSO|nr:unnamed protein product [Schistocephalus solidus]
MGMESPLIMRLMASSVTLAKEAASIIRKVCSGGKLGIVEKGVNDLQTQADRSAQHCIVSSLSHKFPGLCIIGEEDLQGKDQPLSHIIEDMDSQVLIKQCPPALESTALEDVVVWVDPLDGTGEFAQATGATADQYLRPNTRVRMHSPYSSHVRSVCAGGLLEHVTVLIGVAVNGRAVGGVVCQPFYMPDFKAVVQMQQERQPPMEQTSPRLIWGLEGLGLFGIKPEPLPSQPVFEDGNPPESMNNVIVTTRSHPTPNTVAALQACVATKILKVGGCGFKVLMLLEGVAHSYVYANSGCKRWDTCAPEALLNCIGGRLTGLDGKLYSYSKEVHPLNTMGVLATPVAAWHSTYLSRIPTSVVQSLTSTSH